jgi:putative colanic acid biosynthesis acetyltransferase WcaF
MAPRDSKQRMANLATATSQFSLRNKVGRVMWGAVRVILFRPSPRILHVWRRILLRLFGARIGTGVRINPSVKIWVPWNLEMDDYSILGDYVDCYDLTKIKIGANSLVSQYTFLCTGTHDYELQSFPTRSKPITIGEGVWVAADVFVAPGVKIGDGAVVGARANVFKDVAPYAIVGGSPARFIKWRSKE